MDFQQLKYVIEVANCGSINKAAEKLFVSQPNISKAILNLEKELNIIIFNRNTNGVTLTKDGSGFILYARSLLEQFNHIETMYKKPIENNKKRLSIYTQKIKFIYDVFYDFYNKAESECFQFDIRENCREKIVEAVEKSIAEIGFIIVTNVQSKLWKYFLKQKNIEFNELMRGEPCVYLGRNNKLADREILSAEDLKSYTNVRCYAGQESSLNYSLEQSLLGFEEGDINKKICLNDMDVCNELINRIDGYSIGVTWNNIKCSNIAVKEIPLNENSITFTLGWIKKKNVELSEEAKLFLELLKQRIKV